MKTAIAYLSYSFVVLVLAAVSNGMCWCARDTARPYARTSPYVEELAGSGEGDLHTVHTRYSAVI